MYVSVLKAAGELELTQRPEPEPGPGQVLVRVTSVGVCGSDVHFYEHGRIGSYVVNAPMVLGHESAGVVAALGPGVAEITVGQRVSIEPGWPCGVCRQCRLGRYNLCPDVRFFATPPYDGAFTELVAVPAAFAYPVPDALSDDAAALIEPLSVGVWACRRAAVSPDDTVLVTGAGPIGLIAGQCARAYGASRVTITDVNPARLRVAEQLGLRAVNVADTPLTPDAVRADVLLECSGNPTATWDGMLTLNRGGRAVLVGMGGDEVSLPLPHIQDHELTITGAFRYANTWPTAIELAASGAVDLDVLVTGHFGIDDIEGALTAARRNPDAIKAVVHPGQLQARA